MPSLPTHWLVTLGLLGTLAIAWWISTVAPAIVAARGRQRPLVIVIALGSGLLTAAIGIGLGVVIMRTFFSL